MPGKVGARLCGQSSVVSGLRWEKSQGRPTTNLRIANQKVAALYLWNDVLFIMSFFHVSLHYVGLS